MLTVGNSASKGIQQGMNNKYPTMKRREILLYH